MSDAVEPEELRTVTEAEVIRDLTAASLAPFGVGKHDFAVVPKGYSVESLEEFQDKPNRIVESPTVFDVKSLISYLERFEEPERSLGFADAGHQKITVLLDHHHAPNDPVHSEHRVTLTARLHDLWEPWRGISGKWMRQLEMILFLEEHARSVEKPEPADIQDLVMRFDVARDVEFKSQLRLDNMTRKLSYTEDDRIKGEIPVPTSLILLLPIFEGAEPQHVEARFRYKIEGGKLAMMVKFDLLRMIEAEAFERLVDLVRVERPDLKIVNGVPL